jgi:hypothetical protein
MLPLRLPLFRTGSVLETHSFHAQNRKPGAECNRTYLGLLTATTYAAFGIANPFPRA